MISGHVLVGVAGAALAAVGIITLAAALCAAACNGDCLVNAPAPPPRPPAPAYPGPASAAARSRR